MHLLLEIHYHRPDTVSWYDSSGYVLTITDRLRPHDAGVLVLLQGLPQLSIPPQQPAYNVSVYCPVACLDALPADGVTVFGSFMHTHAAAVAMRTDHYRGGRQLEPIDRNDHYDSNFQQTNSFPPSQYRRLQRGDALKLTCTYSTMRRSQVTVGGISTSSEMCMDYLSYWPADYSRSRLQQCYGMTLAPYGDSYSTQCRVGPPTQWLEFSGLQDNVTAQTPTCTPAPEGSREWGSAAARSGTTGAVAISPEQWQQDRASFSRSLVLDALGRFVLYWNVTVASDGADDAESYNGVIRFAAEVETTGWFGIGLSASGGMADSDAVVGWVQSEDEGAASAIVHLTDRCSDDHMQPAIDSSQDVWAVRGLQTRLSRSTPPDDPIYYRATCAIPPPNLDLVQALTMLTVLLSIAWAIALAANGVRLLLLQRSSAAELQQRPSAACSDTASSTAAADTR